MWSFKKIIILIDFVFKSALVLFSPVFNYDTKFIISDLNINYQFD